MLFLLQLYLHLYKFIFYYYKHYWYSGLLYDLKNNPYINMKIHHFLKITGLSKIYKQLSKSYWKVEWIFISRSAK